VHLHDDALTREYAQNSHQPNSFMHTEKDFEPGQCLRPSKS